MFKIHHLTNWLPALGNINTFIPAIFDNLTITPFSKALAPSEQKIKIAKG